MLLPYLLHNPIRPHSKFFPYALILFPSKNCITSEMHPFGLVVSFSIRIETPLITRPTTKFLFPISPPPSHASLSHSSFSLPSLYFFRPLLPPTTSTSSVALTPPPYPALPCRLIIDTPSPHPHPSCFPSPFPLPLVAATTKAAAFTLSFSLIYLL